MKFPLRRGADGGGHSGLRISGCHFSTGNPACGGIGDLSFKHTSRILRTDKAAQEDPYQSKFAHEPNIKVQGNFPAFGPRLQRFSLTSLMETGRFHSAASDCCAARRPSMIDARWSMMPVRSEFANAMRPKGLFRSMSPGAGSPFTPKKK